MSERRHLSLGNFPRPRGFTVIELIAVIVLAGILGATVYSRLAGDHSYRSTIVRDQIIASARSAQQKALGHRDVKLSLQADGDALLLTVHAGDALQLVDVPLRGIKLRASTDASGDCDAPGTLISGNDPLELDYVLPGNLHEAGGVPVGQHVHICVAGSDRASVCIAATGFAYAGECKP